MDMSISRVNADADSKQSDREGKHDDHDEIRAKSYNSTASVDVPDTISMARMNEEHAVDVDEIRKSIREGSSHARGSFSYLIDDLPIKHRISRDVDLDEMTELDYVTEGSHSHIFCANWHGEQVIIKVSKSVKYNRLFYMYLIINLHSFTSLLYNMYFGCYLDVTS